MKKKKMPVDQGTISEVTTKTFLKNSHKNGMPHFSKDNIYFLNDHVIEMTILQT
jgi:hypothetical protein